MKALTEEPLSQQWTPTCDSNVFVNVPQAQLTHRPRDNPEIHRLLEVKIENRTQPANHVVAKSADQACNQLDAKLKKQLQPYNHLVKLAD